MAKKTKCPHGGDWSIGCEELARLQEAEKLVNKQAEDEGLWFIARTAPEAYLQQELRKLHAAIEGRSPEECVKKFFNEALRGEGA